MSREWQPGDVAILNDGRRVFIATDPSDHTLSAIDANGMWYSQASIAFRDARPLAAVDPQDPIPDEWVRVFGTAYFQSKGTFDDCARAGLAALFAHIANPQPPKPAEPTDHAAVVRDRDGNVWMRTGEAWPGHMAWTCSNFLPYKEAHWDELDIPEDGILWHGVGGDS